MSSQVQAVPDEYKGAVPYLCIKGASEAIEFYKKAFGAVEVLRHAMPGGLIGHAELKIGNDILFMLADEFPDFGFLSPKTIGGTPVTISFFVENVDAFINKAVEAGATLKAPIQDQFYGDRSGKIEDPFGHAWHISTHIEDLTPDEIDKRAAALFSQPDNG